MLELEYSRKSQYLSEKNQILKICWERLSLTKLMSQYDIIIYYMALSHKDWELPNSQIWLAEMDIDRGLDFPIYTGI